MRPRHSKTDCELLLLLSEQMLCTYQTFLLVFYINSTACQGCFAYLFFCEPLFEIIHIYFALQLLVWIPLSEQSKPLSFTFVTNEDSELSPVPYWGHGLYCPLGEGPYRPIYNVESRYTTNFEGKKNTDWVMTHSDILLWASKARMPYRSNTQATFSRRAHGLLEKLLI